ncbi:MAG TPA: hypothetical protein VKT78_19825, partial [Fimbriimonadaceae bacterium]|nr:hypothetical protein [Fimbriimonadaceae bacterium]
MLTSLVFGFLLHSQAQSGPLLMIHPTMNRTHIVFQLADNLWSVPREGGEASRLTNEAGAAFGPTFSPDGSRIAFTGDFDGRGSPYVIPAEGGTPHRLTPVPGIAVGWTADGNSVLFRSRYRSDTNYFRLYTVPAGGGVPTELPFPAANEGSFSPDGSQLAYVPGGPQQAWKRYRGGATLPIWIGRLSDSTVTKVPRNNSNDRFPMWVGNRIYFISDRGGPFGLYSF